MALVDEAECLLDDTLVHRSHDRRRHLMAVSGQQGEEGTQGRRVQRGIGAVAVGCATGGRKDADLLVVPDRLRGQTVPARQINRPEPFDALKLLRHEPAYTAKRFQPWFNDTVECMATTEITDTAHCVEAAAVMRLLPARPRLLTRKHSEGMQLTGDGV